MQLMATLAMDGKTCQDNITRLLEPEPSFMECHGIAVAHSVALVTRDQRRHNPCTARC